MSSREWDEMQKVIERRVNNLHELSITVVTMLATSYVMNSIFECVYF